MRRACLLAAAICGLVASHASAAFVLSTQRVAINSTLDRVTLYALATGTSGDVFAADLTVTTNQTNGLMFTVVPANDEFGIEASVLFLSPNPEGATRSRANRTLFNTVAPGFPSPSTAPPAGPTIYSQGVTSFQIVGFDGRDPATNDVGLKAGPGVNGVRGAALFAAVVPTRSIVTFAGSMADEQGTLTQVAIQDDPVIIIDERFIIVVPPAPQTVTFGQVVTNGAAFSVTVTAVTSNMTDVLTLALSTLPAGVSGISVSPAAGSTSPATFTVTGTLNYSTNGTTVTIPFVVADNFGGATPGAIVLNVVPEPTVLMSVGALAALTKMRRRR